MHSQRPSLKVLQFPEDGRRVMKYGNHRASPGLEGEIRERLAAGDAEDTHRRARQEGEFILRGTCGQEQDSKEKAVAGCS